MSKRVITVFFAIVLSMSLCASIAFAATSDSANESDDGIQITGEVVDKCEVHTPVVVPGYPATCTESGLTDGEKCSVCGQILKRQELIFPADHSFMWSLGEPATCETDGFSMGLRCSICNEILEAEEIIPATGHDYGEWVVIREATPEQSGLRQRVCKNDPSHVEQKSIRYVSLGGNSDNATSTDSAPVASATSATSGSISRTNSGASVGSAVNAATVTDTAVEADVAATQAAPEASVNVIANNPSPLSSSTISDDPTPMASAQSNNWSIPILLCGLAVIALVIVLLVRNRSRKRNNI